MEKLLTIVIPTYRRTSELRRALEAIALQYDERAEILVCDDASPDNTEEVVAEVSKKLPVRYLRNPTNLGFDRNFIHCYREATGKFVLMMGNDDFLIQGGLKHILSYLEENPDVDWVYINVAPFWGACSCLETNLKPKGTEIADKAHISKKEFIAYTDSSITALASIVRRERILKIPDWEKYIGTYFIHTCLWLEATKADESVLGIIGKPCIAYHYTNDESSDSSLDPSLYFGGFYQGYRHIFYEIGPACGYDRTQMLEIFVRRCGRGRNVLLKMNAAGTPKWKRTFWETGYPAIRDVPAVCLRVLPLVCLPSFVARFLVNHGLPLYRKWKNKSA